MNNDVQWAQMRLHMSSRHFRHLADWMPKKPRRHTRSVGSAGRRLSPPESRRLHSQAILRVAMADQDEDISHLRAPDATDYDPTEETQDFRLLEKLTCVISHAQPALFFPPLQC
jgi:hypothetical protein